MEHTPLYQLCSFLPVKAGGVWVGFTWSSCWKRPATLMFGSQSIGQLQALVCDRICFLDSFMLQRQAMTKNMYRKASLLLLRCLVCLLNAPGDQLQVCWSKIMTDFPLQTWNSVGKNILSFSLPGDKLNLVELESHSLLIQVRQLVCYQINDATKCGATTWIYPFPLLQHISELLVLVQTRASWSDFLFRKTFIWPILGWRLLDLKCEVWKRWFAASFCCGMKIASSNCEP